MQASETIGAADEAEAQLLVRLAKTSGFADQARTAIVQIQSIELPAELTPWVAHYQQVGKRRPFLWAWVFRGLDITTLSSVQPSLRTPVLVTKLLGVMLDVLLDDIADVRQDMEMLESALEIVSGRGGPAEWDRFGEEGQRYLQCIVAVWSEIRLRVQSLPRFPEFTDILTYDYNQLFNTMRYAVLINRHTSLLNLAENELYQPHNMHMMVNWTIDLMASPGFIMSELGLLREVGVRGQLMGRIGNQVSTWERELKDADYSSAVFGYALREGFIDHAQIQRWDKEQIRKTLLAMDVESFFLRQWQRLHDEILLFADRIVSVDVRRLLTGLNELIRLHLGSKGLK